MSSMFIHLCCFFLFVCGRIQCAMGVVCAWLSSGQSTVPEAGG